jgi:hypothetical protein
MDVLFGHMFAILLDQSSAQRLSGQSTPSQHRKQRQVIARGCFAPTGHVPLQ